MNPEFLIEWTPEIDSQSPCPFCHSESITEGITQHGCPLCGWAAFVLTNFDGPCKDAILENLGRLLKEISIPKSEGSDLREIDLDLVAAALVEALQHGDAVH